MPLYIFLFFFFNIYLFILEGGEREREREREREIQAGGGARIEEKENPRQAPHCQHRARHGAQSQDHEIMTRAEIKNWMLN